MNSMIKVVRTRLLFPYYLPNENTLVQLKVNLQGDKEFTEERKCNDRTKCVRNALNCICCNIRGLFGLGRTGSSDLYAA